MEWIGVSLGPLLAAGVLTRVFCTLLNVVWFAFLARVIWSWLPVPRGGLLLRAYELLVELTDPVLKPLRKLIPPIQAGGMGVDVSAILVFVIARVLQQALCS